MTASGVAVQSGPNRHSVMFYMSSSNAQKLFVQAAEHLLPGVGGADETQRPADVDFDGHPKLPSISGTPGIIRRSGGIRCRRRCGFGAED